MWLWLWLYVFVCVWESACSFVCMPGIKWIVCNMLDYRHQLNIRLHNEIIYFCFSFSPSHFEIECDWLSAFGRAIKFPAPQAHSLLVLLYFFLPRTQGLDTLLDACRHKLRLRFRFAIILAYKYCPPLWHTQCTTFYLLNNVCYVLASIYVHYSLDADADASKNKAFLLETRK